MSSSEQSTSTFGVDASALGTALLRSVRIFRLASVAPGSVISLRRFWMVLERMSARRKCWSFRTSLSMNRSNA